MDASSTNPKIIEALLNIENGYAKYITGDAQIDSHIRRKLSKNPMAVDLLLQRENWTHIDYYGLCMNESDAAINFLLKSFGDHTWNDKIFPDALHTNKNPRAKRLIDLYLKGCNFANRKECITYFAEKYNIDLVI